MTGCLRYRLRNRRCGCSAAGSTRAVFMSIGNSPKLRAGSHRLQDLRSTPSWPSLPPAPSPESTRSHGCGNGCRIRAAPCRRLVARRSNNCSNRQSCRQPVQRALELRLGGAQAAVKKIDSLLARAGDDDRVRGAFRYHGAATGRWAGEGFQPQNLKRPVVDDLAAAIDAVSTGDYAHVKKLYPRPLAVVGDCTRSMITAAPGTC